MKVQKMQLLIKELQTKEKPQMGLDPSGSEKSWNRKSCKCVQTF